MMRRTILSVAYPFAPVGLDAVGGAEQILTTLDHGLVAAGHRSIVIAEAGSRCAGEWVATPATCGPIDDEARARAHAEHRAAILAVLERERVDLIHAHGHDADGYLPEPGMGPAQLITLHLQPDAYAPTLLDPRPGRWWSCVSASQARRFVAAGVDPIATIDNGVDLERLRPGDGAGDYAVALGRICPEKGFHQALDAARLAGVELRLAGEVFPYPDHQRYFAEQLRPRLDARRRFLGPVGRAAKPALLAGARCLVAPSEIAETSSLVAMEALACATPVVSFGAGALADLVEHGRTGLTVPRTNLAVQDERALAAALVQVRAIDRQACRRAAEQRFAATRMVAEYLAVYERLRTASSLLTSSMVTRGRSTAPHQAL